jgi:glycogen debranching enzyme
MGVSLVREIYNDFEPVLNDYGVGSIAEIYDGNPPHQPRGAISQAWSVSSLLQIGKMIEQIDQEETLLREEANRPKGDLEKNIEKK